MLSEFYLSAPSTSKVDSYPGNAPRRASGGLARQLITVANTDGHLAQKKQRPPRTLQWDYAYGPMVALGGGCFL